MAKISSGLILTTDYFMRDFYKNNRDAAQKNGRGNYSRLELSYEDSRALSLASKRMLSAVPDADTDEEELTEPAETMLSRIKAFADTYNNAIDSGGSGNDETRRCIKQLKALGKSHAEELGELGITIERDGRLKIDESLLKMADSSKVSRVFSEKSEFATKSLSIAKRLNGAIHDNLLAQMNGNGLNINIRL